MKELDDALAKKLSRLLTGQVRGDLRCCRQSACTLPNSARIRLTTVAIRSGNPIRPAACRLSFTKR
jgi:hypothetical protein